MTSASRLPSPSKRRIALHIKPAAERAVRQGHPWLFEGSIIRQNHPGKAGDLAVVFDKRRRFLAIGLYDPFSPIRVRILHQGQPTPINVEWLAQKVAQAAERRAGLPSVVTTAFRLVHGANDGLPGLVIDRYGDTLVLKMYSAAWASHLAHFVEALEEASPFERLVLRMGRRTQEHVKDAYGLDDGQVLKGPDVKGDVPFLENGLRFKADVVHGQKTGFFLDQRENRARSERLVAADDTLERVLNVFAYTGGFSLYTARGGARSIVSLDASKPALEMAEHHFQLNRDWPGVAASEHHVLAGDAFQTLEHIREKGEFYDLVIADPPAFAHSENDVSRAINAYKRLTELSLSVVRPGGAVMICSCTGRVSSRQFYRTVQETAKGSGRALVNVAKHGHPRDHPVGFAEGEYLKCVTARVS